MLMHGRTFHVTAFLNQVIAVQQKLSQSVSKTKQVNGDFHDKVML